jgi:periplasmic protein TonB
MNNVSRFEELDQAIEAIFAGSDLQSPSDDPELAELLQVACELRELPRAEFKTRLKTELEWVASARPLSSGRQGQTDAVPSILPSLFGSRYGGYPVRQIHFLASAALHTAAVILLLSLGMLSVKISPKANVVVASHIISFSEYVPPAGNNEPGGGGSGGGAEKIDASHGGLPKTAAEQLTPPVVVVRNADPKLPAEPTIIAPDLQVPQSNQVGDPLSKLMTPSNGPGVRGGIGPNAGDGIGRGEGPGYGSGGGGNVGGNLYRPGNGISAPRPIYDPEPEYSPEARAAKYQGTVILQAIISPDGRPRDLRVARSLGMGLDEKAVEAVYNWLFEPARKDGRAVPVMIQIEVSFHLY